jgi:hypothetical protein
VPDPLKRLKQGFLDKVVGVAHVARPSRQAARRPALQRTQVASEKAVDRFLVAGARPIDQVNGRLSFWPPIGHARVG